MISAKPTTAIAMTALVFASWTGMPRAEAGVGRLFQGQATKARIERGRAGAVRGQKRWERQHRRQQRRQRLARDPAHGGKRNRNSIREAEVGMALERIGKLVGPIRREKTGAAEFVDGNGTLWDVKAFNSNFPRKAGGFHLPRALKKIGKELGAGQNVILDTKDLSPRHEKALRQAVKAKGWIDRIAWYPPR